MKHEVPNSQYIISTLVKQKVLKNKLFCNMPDVENFSLCGLLIGGLNSVQYYLFVGTI